MEEEEEFTLTWGDTSGEVVQTEEVICDMPPEMLSEETDEFPAAVAQNGGGVQEENIMYLTADNVLVMPQTADDAYMECQEVTEEVVAETWEENCPEEIIVGSEEAVVSGQAVEEDIEVPLPTDQDEYTAARPYPCDFCSRRFRKKANLMNHMVAHQTDRPHGCNLCGVRYIRKCDLMNHLKSHAYIPDGDTFDDDDLTLDEGDDDKSRKKQKAALKKRRKQKIKEEFDTFESEDVASSSRSYNYANEDIKLMEVMDNNGQNEYTEYLEETHGITEQRFPITDAKKPFVCQHCGVSFAREKALASHSRIHGGDSPFECQKCGEMFWDADSVRDHMRAKHGGDIENFDEDLSEDDNKYGTYYCATCGLSFHRQDNLKRHQKVHVKDEMKNDDYSTEREEEYGHICNVCGESFPEALDLLAHAEVHARTTEHRCMMCGEVCEDEQSVAAHVQSVHGEELTPNTCMLCGRVCKDRRTLLKHSWEHTKEKMFECSKCDKTFHNKARLKRHMFSHRNKIVTCEECGDEFPDGRSLMNHRHSHSSVSGRQFPCRECGKTFGSRSSQQIHIRIHTGERPYGCRFCWKAFADGGTLRKHERIHTGEKPYACAVCPRAFNQRVVLREHIRSHHSGPDPNHTHSVTPYCCSVCSDMFSTSQDLIVHLIHHCDMNTAMKRQPQIGPRKYKRRRKLKPHELDLISKCQDDEMEQEQFTESDTEERAAQPQRKVRKTKKSPPKTPPTFSDLYNTCSSTIENIRIMVDTGKTPPKKDKNKKAKPETPPVALPSRPKMIHTQKTRVAVEATEDGKVRHKTKTLVTRTQPTELKSATGERIRPRTKNVNYHVFSSDKLPLATFPDDAEAAVNNLLKEQDLETDAADATEILLDNGNEEEIGTPEVAQEQTVETEEPTITNFIKVDRRSSRRLNNSQNSLKPGRTIIGPGSKVVRLVKGGMIVSKKKSTEPQTEPENIFPDDPLIKIKEEFIKQEVVDASPLHELAEISMQHAQNLFKCEMCSEVFTDRAQLLVHVPIHI